MRQTTWVNTSDGFEESLIICNNGMVLLTLRRWDVINDIGAVIRAVGGNKIVKQHTARISQEDLTNNALSYLRSPFIKLKALLGVNTPQICGMFRKKFELELKEFLHGKS